MTTAVKEYLWREPNTPDGGNVEFRLTYAGPLYPDNAGSRGSASHKHELRKHFHGQLRRLWAEWPHLSEPTPDDDPTGSFQNALGYPTSPPTRTRAERLADQFQRNGYRFAPLITRDLILACAVDVLFLRPEPPGRIVRSGDIDNRIKTLFDGLKMPANKQDFGGYDVPADGEDPFYCLVEDDALITSLSVETDVLLEPIGEVPNRADARLIITVRIRPARVTLGNLDFA